MRIKYLEERLLNARMILQSRQDDIKQWEEEREDGEEALQIMMTELEELKKSCP